MSRDEVLARLVELPVSTWTYGWDDPSVKHLGPMAQDFAKAFGLGSRDDRIDLVDGQGVLIAAVQALHDRVVVLEQLGVTAGADRDDGSVPTGTDPEGIPGDPRDDDPRRANHG